MANGLPWVGSSGKAPDPRTQFAPKPGSYTPPPPSTGAGAAETGDAQMDEWLKPWPPGGPDSGGQFFSPGRRR